MTLRSLVPLLVFLALLAAPFGRMGMAEAAMPHPAAPMAMSGHCADMPAPEPGKPSKSAIDCMVACAAVATESAVEIAFASPDPVAVVPRPLLSLHGIQPEAADPPPRS
ncbi:hypothetical protein RCO27_11040 [Sphingosinicella sp. LHD-64]|uniref:hypothetical protein n=1 Tax=Sphingosinicella sp. LHD-64 TaxID=3072139 RepID=UPI0028103175|nr:hypothetical protein [Sphingosinicella sp. LHD-64]MDQ8756764.1 hypothetical protein [Sphingosinicella sp. LHD-64]